ncbi:hypothetical protein HDU76_007241 [Blyttiomyces sp. JEL0837]|nr:hypothetical protein HDU76_007241 [Blyttiomyces sp. JEL0837]
MMVEEEREDQSQYPPTAASTAAHQHQHHHHPHHNQKQALSPPSPVRSSSPLCPFQRSPSPTTKQSAEHGLEKLGNDDDDFWVAYKVPPHLVDSVKEHLDFREQNGYATYQVDVFRCDVHDGPIIRNALIYVGTTDNPAFLGPESVNDMAMHIAKSVGHSGRNIDYFLNLCHAVRLISRDHPDSHLSILEGQVRQIANEFGIPLPEHTDDESKGLEELMSAGVKGLEADEIWKSWEGVWDVWRKS